MKWLYFPEKTSQSGEIELIFSAYEDSNDFIYYLGTNGYQSSFSNPIGVSMDARNYNRNSSWQVTWDQQLIDSFDRGFDDSNDSNMYIHTSATTYRYIIMKFNNHFITPSLITLKSKNNWGSGRHLDVIGSATSDDYRNGTTMGTKYIPSSLSWQSIDIINPIKCDRIFFWANQVGGSAWEFQGIQIYGLIEAK